MKLRSTLITAVTVVMGTLASAAHAALDTTIVDGIKTEVLGDVDLAVAAGFGIMAVVLGASVGMSLLGRFISKGANGG